MAHRGRLNVLANIFNKTYESIFRNLKEKNTKTIYFDGDVKNITFLLRYKTDNGNKVKLTLSSKSFSFREAVDPIVEGIAKVKKSDFQYLGSVDKIAPILIHGMHQLLGKALFTK